MKGKRVIAGILLVGILATALAGCKNADVTKKEREKPVITLGSDSYPPYNYLNEDGIPTGIDVELATEAFRRMGYQVDVVQINWEKKKELVESGEIDCIMGCFSMEGRLDDYRWAGPYIASRQVVAVNESSDIYKLSDLEGKNLAVQSTTKPESIFLNRTDERIPKLGNLISLGHRELIYTFLGKGYVDAVAAHEESIVQYMKDYDGKVILEYSPESFTGTEMDYALDICNAVQRAWGPTPDNQMIINLPSTVEMTTPNVFADQIEWMSKHLENRESIVLSVHPHNDRGTGVAAAELAMLAGADRVEGTLFGNGERTGNVDILTIAYNMFSQGIDPELEIGDIKKIAEVYERCTKMHIDPRHPYAGKLVFTAFSGSHQDAINKGMHALMERKSEIWQVPYLPIDPSDIGREYEPVVRINSQSGKGGVAFVMDSFFGFKLPRGMHKEFADVIQKIAEKQGEVAPEQIMEEFRIEYLDRKEPYHFRKCKITDFESGDQFTTVAVVTYSDHGETKQFEGVGNGPIDAVKRGLEEELGISIKVLDYSEHALTSGSGAQAASYIHLMDQKTGKVTYGVGISSNITRASLRGIFSAVNRLFGDAE